VSENETRWVVETKPVASTVIPTPEALVACERERRRPPRERGENPFLRRLSPRRSPWPDVTAYDERALALGRRAAALNEEITGREEALVRAREADDEALTAWQLGDRKEPRPEPTVPALAAAERIYEDKQRYVERQRHRLLREEEKEVREAQERYERAIAEAEQARQDLVDCRTTWLWARFFPDELAIQAPDMGAIATSLRKPIEAELQVQTRLDAAGLFRVLRGDAAILAQAMTHEQARELGLVKPSERDVAMWQTGKPDYVGPRFPAVWDGTPEQAEQKSMIERYAESMRRRLSGE